MGTYSSDVDKYIKAISKVAPHVDVHVARGWVEDVLRHDAQRIDWHIRRLGALGGTDLSRLVCEDMGKRSFFGSARDVVQEKLCIQSPFGDDYEEAIGHFERGAFLEPVARKKTKEKYGLIPYEAGINAKKAFLENGGCEEHPWLHGSEDDLLIDPVTKKVYLVDYKCPASPETAEGYINKGAAIEYVVQLSTYLMIFEMAGVHVDEVALVPLHPSKFDVTMVPVLVTEKIKEDILKAGDKYWNDYILQNELPRTQRTRTFENVEQLPGEVQNTLNKLTYLTSIRGHAEKEEKKIKQSLLEQMDFHGFAATETDIVRMGPMESRKQSRSTVNTDMLQRDLVAARMQLGMSADEAYTSVMDNGDYTKTSEFVKVAFRLGKKHEYADRISSLKETAFADLNDSLDMHMEDIEMEVEDLLQSELPNVNLDRPIEPENVRSLKVSNDTNNDLGF